MRGFCELMRLALVPGLVVGMLGCDRNAASRDTLSDSAADTVAAAPAPPAPDTSRPVFEIDLWPGEGIPMLEAATNMVTLHRRPSPASPVTHQLQVAVGQRITYDSTTYQTMAPAPIRVLAPFNVRGRVLGNVTRLTRDRYYSSQYQLTSLPVDTTSQLEMLQYRAEGSCFVRLNGRVVDAQDCPAMNSIEFALEGEPVTRLWARVVDGRRVGWALVSDSTVRIAGRQF